MAMWFSAVRLTPRVIAIVAVRVADILSSPLIMLSNSRGDTLGCGTRSPLRLPHPVSAPEKGDSVKRGKAGEQNVRRHYGDDGYQKGTGQNVRLL
jgi:hypothetical protein